ncbi:ricin-type beta-trefoil lectin domain protein [Dactylosporangium vinaceum]|uniref:Ricin-type beta-trefoil lectin domain protein n=1 Tax=Dactylosporangium vinaceum TaxID=53362 RepID=A0ABV5M3A5_9ACTN|nr:ricin-type beta-trefoil lectin domain protein [Dactylosporangium vinaceum]UAB99734.1 ricin-type beta-trefoil lectin domain protein [Dactylosporangium vinaceum]
MRRRVIEGAGPTRLGIALIAVVLGAFGLAAGVLAHPASAADNPYQRGPDPTVAGVAATNGPFATAQLTVPAGNGFNGGSIYYPTDTSLGTWGAVAIVPGYSALFANEEAWMGPRLASFGFVVIGIETNSRTDGADARGMQLLAALDYLTQRSPVRDRVDPDRLSVMGHSAGGAGALLAAMQRPSLRAVVGLAPGSPTGLSSLSTDRVPTLFVGGQTDPTVTPAYLDNLYATLPATTQSAYVQLSGADHLFFTRANNVEIRRLVPWLKLFVDNDTRYTQFMCPTIPDPTGVSRYSAKCPLIPPGGPTPSPSSASPSSHPSASASVSAQPSRTPPASGAQQIVGSQSGRCVTATSQSAGTQVQLQDCAGQPGATWTYTAGKQLQGAGNLCLDANGAGTGNGTQVIVWSCNGQANQQWNVNSGGTITGVQSGLCMDANGAGTANGTKIILWSCNGQANQRWSLR